MPLEIAFDFQAAVGESAQVLVVPSESHGYAYRDGKAAYENAAAQVLDAAAQRPHETPLAVAAQ